MSRRTFCYLIWSFCFVALPSRFDCDSLGRISNKRFVALVERLSEESGFFDSDNLVSNEASYLQIFGKLDQFGDRKGIYLGVGPDQNFSYIAKLRPRLAILIDIRRRNLLYHLMFKGLFEMSHNRAEFLCNLFSKPLPPRHRPTVHASLPDLVSYVEEIQPTESVFRKNLSEILQRIRNRYEFHLTEVDVRSIREIYREFYTQQLEIRFRSFGRPNFRFYPSFKEMLLEHDLEGRWGNYLHSEESFNFVKKLHARNRIIPVVGDFAGSKALPAIAEYLREIKETVTTFYVSNVEFYLMQNEVFRRFGENVKLLPITENSFLIRAYFRFPHPERRPGYISATVLQKIDRFVRLLDEGKYHSYQDLGLEDYLGNE